MDRKRFLGTAGALLSGIALPAAPSAAAEKHPQLFRKPPYLKPGDLIGITAPAGSITAEEIKPAVDLMQSWGFAVQAGDTIGKKDFTFGGTDQERLTDLQAMLDNRKIRAIMCARGGYGSVRIVDSINWERFKKHPKWIIGFSDITVLLNHIHHNVHIAAIHSKMCNSFPDDWATAEPIQVDTINSIHEALSGKRMVYEAAANQMNRLGKASGVLVGGNLKTIESLTGSTSDINAAGKLLFVEDTGEYLYSIDRMFWNLKRTGKLAHLKGLIVGGFKVKEDDPGEAFGRTVEEIVLEKVKGYRYPVCFDFPVGHQRANYALKCGVLHTLQVQAERTMLTEVKS